MGTFVREVTGQVAGPAVAIARRMGGIGTSQEQSHPSINTNEDFLSLFKGEIWLGGQQLADVVIEGGGEEDSKERELRTTLSFRLGDRSQAVDLCPEPLHVLDSPE